MFDKEPEDIFSGVEPAKQEPLRPAGALSPTVPGRPGEPSQYGATQEEVGEETGGGVGKKRTFLIVAAVVLLLVLGGGGYLAWQQFTAVPTQVIIPENLNVNLPSANVPVTNTPVVNENVNENLNENVNAPVEIPPNIPPPVGIDTDGDGLTDDQELALGTDPVKIDTDGDDLPDREEVEIYFTDPLNPDTDGDGYLDGAEVTAGYDPKGPGKLLILPQ